MPAVPAPAPATSRPLSRDRRRPHYAWVVAGVTFLTLLGASGFRSTPGVLIVPLQEAFGWSRATISFAVSVNLVLFGLAGPFAAALMDRFGVRRVVLVALVLVAAGSGLTVAMHAPWQLDLLWGVSVGLGTGAMATVLAATVATRWFVARRGLVTGALTAASATGQLVFLPLLAWLVQRHGWRSAALAVTAGALAVVPLVGLLMRNRPADLGLRAYGATEDDVLPATTGSPIAAAGRALRLAARTPAWWLLAGSFFICGATTNGLIGTHLIPAPMDHGLGEVTAASLLAVVGIFDIIGTLGSGWLTDRWDSRWLLFWYYALRGLALLFLPYAFGPQHYGLLLFIIVYGLDWVATVPPTVALTRELFGPAAAGVVFGWVFTAHQLGAAAAAWTAGAMRGWLGTYDGAFLGAGVLCLLAAMLVLRVPAGKPTRTSVTTVQAVALKASAT